jgi:glyoxalase superfamily protein
MAKIKDIVFDCESAPQLARFWAAALDDYEIRPYDEAEIKRLAALGLTPETDPTVIVDGPNGSLGFQQVPEGKVAKNRVHVDLISEDRRRDAEQLVGLGASVHAEYHDHTVMADPEGNEFCLYKP